MRCMWKRRVRLFGEVRVKEVNWPPRRKTDPVGLCLMGCSVASRRGEFHTTVVGFGSEWSARASLTASLSLTEGHEYCKETSNLFHVETLSQKASLERQRRGKGGVKFLTVCCQAETLSQKASPERQRRGKGGVKFLTVCCQAETLRRGQVCGKTIVV